MASTSVSITIGCFSLITGLSSSGLSDPDDNDVEDDDGDGPPLLMFSMVWSRFLDRSCGMLVSACSTFS